MATKKKAARKVATKVEAYGNTWTGVVEGTIAQVRAAEAALGVKIPDGLSKLLQSCGCGEPARGFYYSKRFKVEVGVGHIVPLVDQPKINGIVAEASVRRRVIGLPDHFIPFALDNGNSDVLCVDLKTEKIVYWLHDEEPDERGQVVAGSLADFLSGLEESPD